MEDIFRWGENEERFTPIASRESQVLKHEVSVKLDASIKAAKASEPNLPPDPDAWISYGRLFRRQNMLRESIDIYSRGISRYCMYPLLYRHRGHSYLNCYCYDEAVADFEFSLRLDPFNFDCWYHMGVGYFLKQDYQMASSTFKASLKYAGSDEEVVCVSYWYWMALTFLGKTKEARALLDRIPTGLKLTWCRQFYRVLLLYKGLTTTEELLGTEDEHNNTYIILCFGIAVFYFGHGENDKGIKMLEYILRIEGGNRWQGFAYQAALIEKKRREGKK